MAAIGSVATSTIPIVANCGNDTFEDVNGYVVLLNPSAATSTSIRTDLNSITNGAAPQSNSGGGNRLSAANVDAVQVYFSTGNIASGTIKMYGMTTPA